MEFTASLTSQTDNPHVPGCNPIRVSKYYIGKLPDHDLVLNFDFIQLAHCVIERDYKTKKWHLKSLCSTEMSVGGKTVRKNQKQELPCRATIELHESISFQFHCGQCEYCQWTEKYELPSSPLQSPLPSNFPEESPPVLQSSSHIEEMEEMKKQFEALKLENNILIEQNEKLKKKNTDYKQGFRNYEEKIKELEKKSDNYKLHYAKYKKRCEEMAQKLQKADDKKKELEKKISDYKQHYAYTLQDNAKWSEEIQELKKQQKIEIDNALENLKCSICFEVVNEATVLKCGHIFCRVCIERCKDMEVTFPCPLCRAESEHLHSSKKIDDVVKNLMKMFPKN